jgi:hypothetical protein
MATDLCFFPNDHVTYLTLFVKVRGSGKLSRLERAASNSTVAGSSPVLVSNHIIYRVTDNWLAGVSIMRPAAPDMLR